MANWSELNRRMKAAVRRLYPEITSRDWEWIKELPYDPLPGDEIVDRWHSWWSKKGEKRERERLRKTYVPLAERPVRVSTPDDDIPF